MHYVVLYVFRFIPAAQRGNKIEPRVVVFFPFVFPASVRFLVAGGGHINLDD